MNLKAAPNGIAAALPHTDSGKVALVTRASNIEITPVALTDVQEDEV